MKSKKIIQWLDTGIWPCTVLFSCGFSYDELMKHLKKVKSEDWYAGIKNDHNHFNDGNYFASKRTITNSKTGQEKTLFYIILKKQFDFSDYAYVTLAHELHHICTFMLSDILDITREYEAVAYTHTYLMEKILKILRKK